MKVLDVSISRQSNPRTGDAMKLHILICACLVAAPVASVRDTTRQQSDTCRLERSGRATGPSADICAGIGSRWKKLFGTSPVPGSIRLIDRDGYHGIQSGDSWVLESPLPNRSREDSAYRSADGLLRYFAETVIPHEAGHQAFAVFVGSRRVGTSSNQYATQFPDWFDEGVAVWMESPSMREKRVRGVRGRTPSLQKLVTLEHPNSDLVNTDFPGFRMSTRTVMPPCARCTWLADSLKKKFQIIDSGTDDTGRQKTVIWFTDQAPGKNGVLEEREFYPLAYSLLRFIRLTGGVAAIHELVSRYQTNPTPRLQALSGLPGMPVSVDALEKAWHAFLAAPPREDK
jgi:hypothetical protein